MIARHARRERRPSVESDGLDVIADDRAVQGGGAQHFQAQPGIVHLGIEIFRSTAQPF